ncbi:TIGR00645 family protein [Fastidiosibacter lacustris]|uniref:TIGR00645 family protein n=1 Tax=Fastidiosibacter lacustris TaxID=2056695 RepID=UPI000E344117|nr:TIGR00645 family protein [Fastidiosibacter lacustris]
MLKRSADKLSKLEVFLERAIFASRWIQAPIYLILVLVLLAFVYQMASEVLHLFMTIKSLAPHELIVLGLTLCDTVLVANLIVIVIISGYENFVSKIDVEHKSGEPIWIKRLSHTGVKLKIAGSIVAISSISLLKQFLDIPQLSNRDLMWYVLLHLTFLVSALILVFVGLLEKKIKE